MSSGKDEDNIPHWLRTDADGQLITKPADAGFATRISSSGYIRNVPGLLSTLVITGLGVTAGDGVDIKDGASGEIIFTLGFSYANQSIIVSLPRPVAFTIGIYASIIASGGSVAVTGVYD